MAPSVTVNGSSHADPDATLDFIETASYYPDDTRAEVPESWQSYLHPNLDVYYFNLGMRLLTTDDIRKPEIRAFLLAFRNDCFEDLGDDPRFQRLPNDWVMTITDCNLTDGTAVVNIHLRSLAQSFKWTQQGLIACPKEQFWAHIAEYPAHDRSIPPRLEDEFVRALAYAEQKTREGRVFPLDGSQIEKVQRQYNYLRAGRSNGNIKAVACIAWLMGAVMPLDELQHGRDSARISDDLIYALTRVHI